VIRVQKEDFDIGLELANLTKNNFKIGGLASFVGLVRDMTGTDTISSMTLEHYPGMTEKQLERIEFMANQKWHLEASLIIHRYGKLDLGDQIVLVACASPHRGEAFDACHFLIDWLKTKAPFWKLEETPSGSNWVDANEADKEATERWILS